MARLKPGPFTKADSLVRAQEQGAKKMRAVPENSGTGPLKGR